MKKRFCLLTLTIAALGLVSCGGNNSSNPDPEPEPTPQPHTHTFSTDWSTDETNHWHAATCGHDVKQDEAPHSFTMEPDGTYESCSCGYVHNIITSLDAPTNLTYSQGKVTFTKVQNAKRYAYTVKKGTQTVLSDTITEAEIDLMSLEVGEYVVSIISKAGNLSSSPAILTVNHSMYKDVDQILEAEDAVTNLKHISIDSLAHGGSYALGFDDCGQGMYFQYFAFEAGERDITVKYATGAPGSYMNMYLASDMAHPIKVEFNEDTGWFGDSRVMAEVTVKATLVKGWNHIYLVKDGESTDTVQWGGYAQIDYIKVAGTQKVFDLTTNPKTMLTEYCFQAESADWHWQNANQRPNTFDDFPMIGYLGEQNATGDGVTFHIKMPQAGSYKLILGAGCDTAQRYFDVTVNGEKENRLIHMGNAWNVIAEDEGFVVNLIEGYNEIDFSRPANGNWSCIDYLKVQYIVQ